MRRTSASNRFVLLSAGVVLGASFAFGQAAAPTPVPRKRPAPKAAPAPRPTPETRAVEILKASCAKLAAAGSMSFTALGAYEVPSLWGPPLIYGRIYEVALQRPDKLAVITVGDGPRTEFYDDGKVIMSFHPAENLVAVMDAPPSIDATLEKLYGVAGTYFPFTDVIVADPWKDMSDGLTGAFYVGESGRRRCDRRRRLRDQRRFHPDMDRQGRPAAADGSRDVPRRSAGVAALGHVLELAAQPGGRPGKVHDDEGCLGRQDSVQPSEDEVGPSGGGQAGRLEEDGSETQGHAQTPVRRLFP
jgi:hypothetical protein